MHLGLLMFESSSAVDSWLKPSVVLQLSAKIPFLGSIVVSCFLFWLRFVVSNRGAKGNEGGGLCFAFCSPESNSMSTVAFL